MCSDFDLLDMLHHIKSANLHMQLHHESIATTESFSNPSPYINITCSIYDVTLPIEEKCPTCNPKVLLYPAFENTKLDVLSYALKHR